MSGARATRCQACGRRVVGACAAHGPAPAPDRVSSPEEPPPRIPGYALTRVIGRGGFGVVYEARAEGARVAVAVKVARDDRPDAAAGLVHEIAALRDIGPPHVPAVLASGETEGGAPFVVMELLESPTLAERMLAGPVSPSAALAMVIAALKALEGVHARGWVHRDLKPENVFVEEVGGDAVRAARIVDFGLGAVGASAGGEQAIAGTAEYMAPEQCEGAAHVDARADLYAAGVILHELIEGAPPFWGSAAAVLQAHAARRPARLASAPRALDAVVQRCLAKDPRDRFPDAASLRRALEELHGAAPEVPPPRPTPPSARVTAPERRTVGLLAFASELDVVAVRGALAPLGGQLAHAAAGRYVAVYDRDLGHNPVRPALRAAHDLLRRGVAARARIDVAPVSAQTRADGTTRYLSAAFARAETFPGAAEPPGVSITEAAAAVLGDPAAEEDHAPPPAPPGRASFVSEVERTPPDAGTDGLIGRDDELEALVESARRAAAERATGVVSVIAEAGHGKTRLFAALGRRLRRHALGEVMEIRAREPGIGGDGTLRALLLAALDLPEAAPPDGGLALLHDRLPRAGVAAAAVALSLGWTAGTEGALGPALQSLGAAPGALRSALVAALGEALARRAAPRPLLCLLDDAHHADHAALAALECAALAESRVPLWICAFARPAFTVAHPTFGERAARSEEHRLGPLSSASAADLCRRLLRPAEDVPEPAVQGLVERSRGVPLLLVELSRSLKRRGAVRRTPRGDAWYVATDELDRAVDIPLVEWLARGELDALADPLKAHARLLALLGDHVTPADLRGVLATLDEQGNGADAPLDAVVGARRLCAAGLLVERDGGFSFRHALVREAIAAAVPEPLGLRVHLAAARHHAGASGEARLAPLAYHAAAAGMSAVAADAYLRLAAGMRARHAYVEAERCYSRALEQPELADRLAALRGRGLMRSRVGRYHDAVEDLRLARALCREAGDLVGEIELLLDEATAFDWMNELRSSEACVESARESAAALADPPPLLLARLHLGEGRSLHRFSREDEAAALLQRAVGEAAALGDEGYETRVIAQVMLGFIHQGLGQLAEARAALDEVITLSEAHRDDLHLAVAINNRALLRACLGDRAGMLADMERGLALARRLGQAMLELVSRYNLAEYLGLMDEAAEAEPHLRRALEIDRRLHGDAGRPGVALLAARLCLCRGDEAGARKTLEFIRAHQAQARAAGQHDALMVPSEEVLCDAVELALHDAQPGAWDALEERSRRSSVGQELIEVLDLRALGALRGGRSGEAMAALGRALEASARIPNVIRARLARRLAEAEAAARRG